MFSKLATSFPCGRFGQIPVRVPVLLPILEALIVLLVAVEHGWKAALFAFLVYGPIMVGSIFIKEVGHAYALRTAGGCAENITLWPVVGVAYSRHEAGPLGDLWVTLAGLLTHIPQAGFWMIVSLFTYRAWTGQWELNLLPSTRGGYIPVHDGEEFGHAVVAFAFWVNVGTALTFLICLAHPWDGGRLFASTMLLCGVSVEIVAKVVLGAAAAETVVLAVLGIRYWHRSFGFLLLVFAAVIGLGNWRLFQWVRAGVVRQHPLFLNAAEVQNLPRRWDSIAARETPSFETSGPSVQQNHPEVKVPDVKVVNC